MYMLPYLRYAVIANVVQSHYTEARSTFGITYPIARASALVLHFDIALILFRQCFLQSLHYSPRLFVNADTMEVA